MDSKSTPIQDRPLRWRNGPMVIGISLLASVYSGFALFQLVSASPAAATCASATVKSATRGTDTARPCPQQVAANRDRRETDTSALVPAVAGN